MKIPKMTKHLILTSWNIWTLMVAPATGTNRPPQCTTLIASEFQHYEIDICAFSETCLPNEESLTNTSARYTFFWKGQAPDEQRIHGVGFAIQHELLPKILDHLKSLDGFFWPALHKEVIELCRACPHHQKADKKAPFSTPLHLLPIINIPF